MKLINVLIVGNGAREHAIAWKVAQSSRLDTLYATPQNPGIASFATCFDVDVMDFEGIIALCQLHAIDLVIVGPEAPLCAGLVDVLKHWGIRAFGPQQQAAILEGSKAFAKSFMKKYGIPTAKYQAFSDATAAKAALIDYGLPVVIKADGLAAGKGVVIAETTEQAMLAIDDMLSGKRFGRAGREIVIEEFLNGVEASQICFVDHNTILPMTSSQDYKRALDGDKGLNTGGMGNYSPSRFYSLQLEKTIERDILQPMITGLKAEGITYSGWLFIGLMIKDDVAKVIEFNVRLGDPEAECLLLRLEDDLLVIIENALVDQLAQTTLHWSQQHAVVVIAASGGYPENYQKGKVIQGLTEVDNAIVFHAGTKRVGDDILTNGGRVLAVSCLGNTLEEARAKAYRQVDKISFDDMIYRRDIAK